VENTREICKTDAEILLCFIALKDSGFAFKYTNDGKDCKTEKIKEMSRNITLMSFRILC